MQCDDLLTISRPTNKFSRGLRKVATSLPILGGGLPGRQRAAFHSAARWQARCGQTNRKCSEVSRQPSQQSMQFPASIWAILASLASEAKTRCGMLFVGLEIVSRTALEPRAHSRYGIDIVWVPVPLDGTPTQYSSFIQSGVASSAPSAGSATTSKSPTMTRRDRKGMLAQGRQDKPPSPICSK